MDNRLRRSAAILLCITFIISFIPAYAFGTFDYNAHDVEKLRAFFELTNNMDYTNGVLTNGSNYNVDDPSTWRVCTWSSAGRLTAISFNNVGAVGSLDLAGCTELTTVNCYSCRLTGLDVTGCSKLTNITLDHNRISAVDVTGCPKLTILWLAGNKLSTLDVTHNPLLSRLDCGSNTNIPELDVTGCPLLTYLDCGENKLTEIDVSNCPLITEFYCKRNQLTELDISNLADLERFISLGNQLKHLDISVLNGGVSFVLDALGEGYVGTVCNVNSSGAHHLANAAAANGGGFYGWYEDSTLLTESTQYECVFGAGAKRCVAHFDVYPHDLTVNYVYENGSQAAPSFRAEFIEGESYSIPSPEIEGYVPDIATVEGVMGGSDVTVTVTYSLIPTPKHTLRIYYMHLSGSYASRTYTAQIEEGASFSVTSPYVANYIPDTDVIEGVMGTEDITYTVYYYPATRMLNISYVYEDGSQAAPAYTAEIGYGESYSVTSPSVAYFTPDITVVEGVMGAEDVFVTVTYSRNMHTLTIYYKYADGSTAAPTYTASIGEGLSYSVTSPVIDGYSVSRPVVSGVMGANNVTVTVNYTRITHELIITYLFEDGSEAFEDYVDHVGEGDSYSVPSPVIDGFFPDIEVVEGVMGTRDVLVTVTYYPIPVPVHELRIGYVYENGGEAAPEIVMLIEEGAEYSVPSPEIDGFYPDIEIVEGVMGEEDVQVTVTYYPVPVPVHELRIDYVFENGDEAAPEIVLLLEEGAEYSVPSPEIEGFYPDIEVVEGVMGEDDVQVAVTYYPVPVPVHELRISYVYENSEEASPEIVLLIEEGAEYSVPSPEIEGFYPDIEVVEGVMDEEDVQIVVTYYPVPVPVHELRIGYVYENGGEAAPEIVMLIEEGAEYSVPSPEIEGFYPDIEVVEGVMGEEDVQIVVTYYPIPVPVHELRIDYVYENGGEAAPEIVLLIEEGAEYSVPSPEIEGFYPDIEIVEGVMGEDDVQVTVTYYPVPVPVHELKISYVYENSEEASPEIVLLIEEGAEYSVPSPEIEGFYPDIEIVEGVMGNEDVHVTVTYYPIPVPVHELRIDYVYENGGEAAPEIVMLIEEGAEYSVPSPEIEGFYADIEVVDGVMCEEDIQITVTYYPIPVPEHELKISYVYENGDEAAPEFTAMLEEGAEFSVPSPVIDGFYADIEVVEGVMGEDDIQIIVVFHPVITVLRGDVDGNGVVNTNDALLLLRCVLGIISPTEQMALAGDVDGSGALNSNDVLLILRAILGIIQL